MCRRWICKFFGCVLKGGINLPKKEDEDEDDKSTKSITSSVEVILPEEIILEILGRVPPQYILKLKYVCKRWFQLISHPNFSYPQQPPQIIFQTKKSDYGCRTYDHIAINPTDKDKLKQILDFHLQLPGNNSIIELKGSCNGLLLLGTKSFVTIYYGAVKEICQLFVCNPFTQQSMEIHLSPVACRNIYFWSLVQDVSTKTYKVVAISRTDNTCFVHTVQHPPAQLEWRRIIRQGFLSSSCLVVVSNHLHLLTRSGLPPGHLYIEAMSLGEEQFTRIDVPSGVPNGGRHHLIQMKGSLYLILSISEDQLDLWVLEDRVKSLWSKTFTIDLGSLGYPLRSKFIYSIFTLGDEMQIYIKFCDEVISFDMTSHKWRFVIGETGEFIIVSAFPHLNSLVTWY